MDEIQFRSKVGILCDGYNTVVGFVLCVMDIVQGWVGILCTVQG